MREKAILRGGKMKPTSRDKVPVEPFRFIDLNHEGLFALNNLEAIQPETTNYRSRYCNG